MFRVITRARAQPLFCSLNLLFRDAPVAVAVVLFFKSPVAFPYGYVFMRVRARTRFETEAKTISEIV